MLLILFLLHVFIVIKVTTTSPLLSCVGLHGSVPKEEMPLVWPWERDGLRLCSGKPVSEQVGLTFHVCVCLRLCLYLANKRWSVKEAQPVCVCVCVSLAEPVGVICVMHLDQARLAKMQPRLCLLWSCLFPKPGSTSSFPPRSSSHAPWSPNLTLFFNLGGSYKLIWVVFLTHLLPFYCVAPSIQLRRIESIFHEKI